MFGINFLRSIGHTNQVYIRCLTPKLTPILELQARGMSYTDKKTGAVNKSTIEGYISLDSGEFFQKFGKEYKSINNGWGQLEAWNRQGYGVYFIVHHNGFKNSEITHGTTLFHESDKLSLEDQQHTLDRISGEFGKPTAVVKTRKSLHAYWASSETISIDTLPTYQRRWVQYSNCDDPSLSDPAQLMRLPGFDHVSWNPELGDFERVPCKLTQLNDVRYSIEQFDRHLPKLDLNQWASRSLETISTEATDRDMRVLAAYLDGHTPNGRDGWDTAKCPAHDGESSDSLHIDQKTGGFICHSGCSSSSIYSATKARAVAAGHRFEIEVSEADDIKSSVGKKLTQINSDYPLANLFPLAVSKSLIEYHKRTAVPQGLLGMAVITCLATLIHPESYLECFGGTDRKAKAIFWFVVYGLSGNGKSHSYQPPLKILRDYGSEAAAIYKEVKKEYDALQKRVKRAKPGEISDDVLEDADKPSPERTRHVIESATIEALISRAAKQPDHGLLMYADELIGWCNRMDPTKGEVEIWLNLKSGNPVDGDRQTREFDYVAAPSISVMGGIQPDVLKKLLVKQEETQNGFVPRLTMARFNETPTQPIRNTSPINYKELNTLFDKVRDDNTQSIVYLDPRCLELAEAWRIETDTQRLSESRKSIKALFPKHNELGYQIAFVLHIINRSLDPTTPEKVPPKTLDAGIGFARWLLNQSISIHEELLESEQTDSFITHFIKSSQHKGWMNARKIGRDYGKKRFKDTASVREFMSKLIDMGLVDSRGTGAKLEVSCPSNFPISVDRLTKQTENNTEKGYQRSTPQVDKVDKISANGDLSTVTVPNDLVDSFSDPNVNCDVLNIHLYRDPVLSTELSTAEMLPRIKLHDILSTLSTASIDKRNHCSETVTNDFVNLSTKILKNNGQNLVNHDLKSVNPAQFVDDALKLENLRSMADSMAALTNLDEVEAIEGLNDFYSIWTHDQMSEASNLLEHTDPIAFARLGELVKLRKSTSKKLDPKSVCVEDLPEGTVELLQGEW